jgi:hypothetical protein
MRRGRSREGTPDPPAADRRARKQAARERREAERDLAALQALLGEWESPEDAEAYDRLMTGQEGRP